jgi:hypothetical protein
MSVNSIIQSQYQAALDMLKEAVSLCPEELWDDTAYKNRFWNIAYHALFYTHLYLQPNLEAFSPWEKHRPDSEQMQASNAYSKTPPAAPYRRAVRAPRRDRRGRNRVDRNEAFLNPSFIQSKTH